MGGRLANSLANAMTYTCWITITITITYCLCLISTDKREQCHFSFLRWDPWTVTYNICIQLTEFKNVPEMLKYKGDKIMKIKLQNFEIYTSYQHNCSTICSSDTKLRNTPTFLLVVKARKWKQETKLELQPKIWNSWDIWQNASNLLPRKWRQDSEKKILKQSAY